MKRFLLLCLLLAFAFVVAEEPAKTNRIALIKTSKGDIYVRLFSDSAPKTVDNFLGLAEGKIEYTDAKTGQKKKGNFYDGLTFHRVIPKFMIQGGDPLGNGKGGPGYSIPDEINGYALELDKENIFLTEADYTNLPLNKTRFDLKINSMESYEKVGKEAFTKKLGENVALLKKISAEQFTKLDKNQYLGYVYDKNLKTKKLVKGSIAMANYGPNTSGSQFFINVVDTPELNGGYTNFGEVIKGMDVVVAISQVETDAVMGVQTPQTTNKPKEDVIIISIRKLTDKEKDELLAPK